MNETCAETLQKQLKKIFGGRFSVLANVFGSPLFWLLLLTFLCFFLYRPLYSPKTFVSYYYVNADTNDYTQYPINLLKGETEIARTPVYPYFLKLVYWLAGSESIRDEVQFTPAGVPISDRIVQGETTCFYVMCAQMTVYWLALIPFYFACGKFLRNPVAHFGTVLFVAIAFIPYQSWILTEPLSISGSLLFFSLMVFYWNRPAIWSACSVSLLSLILTLLRPFFIYLIPLLGAFWLARLGFRKADRKTAFTGLVALLATVSALHGYALQNQKNYGYYTVSSISLMNQFIIQFQSDFFLKSRDSEVLNYIQNSPLNVKASKYRLFHDLEAHFGLPRIQQFVSGTLRANQKEYFIATLKRMWWEGDLYHLTPIYFLGAFEFGLSLLLWLIFRSLPWLRLTLWCFFFCALFVIFFGGIDCQERLILPVLPILYVLFGRYFDLLAQAFSKPVPEVVQYLKETL